MAIFPTARKLPRIFLLQITVLVLLNSFQTANSAKILFLLGLATHSHRVAIQPLATKLAETGHEVTFLSPIQPEVKNPKIKEFCPQALQDINDQLHKDHSDSPVLARLNDRTADPILENFGAVIWGMAYEFNEATLTSPDFLEWLQNSEFDLVIPEHPKKEVGLGIAHKLGAKVITFSPSPLWSFEMDSFGIPTESSWYSSWRYGSPYKFLSQRFHNELRSIILHFQYQWQYLPRIDSLLKNSLGNDIPPVEVLIKNIDLHLINTHFSSDYAKSLPPFVVPVGGMHIQETIKELPKKIEDFISSGSDGFIFISFGTLVKLSALPQETQQGFFNALASFKNARFLLKWNEAIPKYMPKNVLPLKWFPQQDVLAHPKCRGFVSHGGMMSFQQATYYGVPVVIIPVFADQPFNARSVAHHGNGIHLELADLNFDTFSDAIRQMLYSQSLSAKAKEVARRFKDRPMSPLDTAVWWTEYVLRHNDTSHLKPLGIYQTWWQRRMIDFWVAVFIAVVLINVIVFFILRSLVRLCIQVLYKSEDKVKTS